MTTGDQFHGRSAHRVVVEKGNDPESPAPARVSVERRQIEEGGKSLRYAVRTALLIQSSSKDRQVSPKERGAGLGLVKPCR
jgi:hypothetical protein